MAIGHLSLLVSLLGAFLMVGTSHGQQHTDLDRFAQCADCQLRTALDIRLGVSDSALIESDDAWVAFDDQAREYVLVAGPATLAFFDDRGRLLRRIGRRGGGPGEYEVIRAVGFAAGQLFVLDVGQGRWTIIGTDGTPRHYLAPYSSSAGGFVPIAADTAIIAAVLTSPAGVGLPLHLVSISTGDVLRHFGSTTGDYNAASPWARRVFVSVGSNPRSVWLARPDRLRFEEWSFEGALLRVVEGTPSWFPPVERIPPVGQEPPTRMRQFAVDSAGRLWVASWTAAKTWRQAAQQRTSDGEVIITTADYFETRIDVFDLRRQLYLGTVKWEDDTVRLMNRAGEILVQNVEYDADLEPVLSLYRVDVSTSSRR